MSSLYHAPSPSHDSSGSDASSYGRPAKLMKQTTGGRREGIESDFAYGRGGFDRAPVSDSVSCSGGSGGDAESEGSVAAMATAVQRRKRAKGGPATRERERDGSAAKGVYPTPHGYRVQLNLKQRLHRKQRASSSGGSAGSSKFSRNVKDRADAVWLYEAVILMADQPARLMDLLETGNYSCMQAQGWVRSPQQYYAALPDMLVKLRDLSVLTYMEFLDAAAAFARMEAPEGCPAGTSPAAVAVAAAAASMHGASAPSHPAPAAQQQLYANAAHLPVQQPHQLSAKAMQSYVPVAPPAASAAPAAVPPLGQTMSGPGYSGIDVGFLLALDGAAQSQHGYALPMAPQYYQSHLDHAQAHDHGHDHGHDHNHDHVHDHEHEELERDPFSEYLSALLELDNNNC